MRKFLQFVGGVVVLIVAISAIAGAVHKNHDISVLQAPSATPASASASSGSSSGLTESQQNAALAAKEYLQTSGFSKQGLIDQLSSSAGSGYPLHDATVAVNSLHVDWNAQAVRSAREYMQTSPFSCQDLIQQLDSSAGSQYTEAQAHYAATQVGIC